MIKKILSKIRDKRARKQAHYTLSRMPVRSLMDMGFDPALIHKGISHYPWK